MKKLATIYPRDVEPNANEINEPEYNPRSAGRAVVFKDGKIALLHIQKHGYYMLPGGGLDDGEDAANGLARELQEELGVTVAVKEPIGEITWYNERWLAIQTDYCFMVEVVASNCKSDPTDFEVEEGHKVVWADNITAAIKMLSSAYPNGMDGKLIILRDLRFLEEAERALSK